MENNKLINKKFLQPLNLRFKDRLKEKCNKKKKLKK